MPIQDGWALDLDSRDPSIPNLPLETPAAVSGSAPFSADWLLLANPVRPALQAGYIAPAVNLLTTTLAVAVTLVARDPLVTKRPVQPAPQAPQVTANLNESTLAPVVTQAPFTPQHTAQVSTRQVQQSQPLANTLTLQTVQAPLGTVLFVQPNVVPRVQDSLPQNLLPLAPVVAVQAPFIGLQTDAVTGRVVRQPDIAANTLPLGAVAPPAPPFSQSDWPRPISAKVVQQPDVQNSELQLLTYVAPSLPLNNSDWQNPILSRKVQQPLMPDRHEGVTAPTETIPPRQLDWPNPVLAKQVKQPEPINGVLQALTYVAPELPFRQSDWPNPQRVEFKVGTHALDTGSYRSEAPAVPVDWPRQIIARQVQQPDIPTGGLQLLTFVPASPPYGISDWPKPIVARAVQQPEPVNGVLQLLTYVAPPLPYNNSDWPNPTLPILPVQDTAQYQNPDLITPAVEPPVTTTVRRGGGKPNRSAYPAYKRPRLNEQLDALLESVSAEMAYEDVAATAPAAIKAKAEALIRPYADTTVDVVDWAALEADAKRIGALMALWAAEQARLKRIRDDDEWLMWED